MNNELFLMLQNALHFLIIMVTCLAVCVILATYFLGKKRKLWVLCGYLLVKAILVNTLLGLVIRTYYAELYEHTYYLQVCYQVSMCVAALLSFCAYYYTFKGSIYKIMLVSLICDILGNVLGHVGVLTVDLLSGRELSFSDNGSIPFQPVDLLIPVVSLACTFLVLRLVAPWIPKIQQYEIRHTKVMAVLFCFYITSSTWTLLHFLYSDALFGIVVCLWMWLLLFIALLWSAKQREFLENEKSFLHLQQQLAEAHYNSVQKQAQYIAHSQTLIEQQMQEIRKAAPEVRSKKILEYIKGLQEDYHVIGDAVYCNDWMIDAALLSQAELLKSEGITFDCALPGFYCGQMPRQELLYLILFLLNLGSTEIRETAGERTLFFHVNTIANQLIIELTFPMQEKRKLPERQI
ncbi:MAG: hypothetical protein PHQ72_05690 [Hespellia sp.]|nr:hypothetical protein [Hespellia sp.]